MDRRNEARRESGQPGGGAGRRDEVGRSGVWPASGPLPPGDAPVVGQGELGQGTRGAAGAADSGGSELLAYRTDPVCGAQVNPEHAAATAEHAGRTWFFDSEECRRRFEDAPARYAERSA